MNWKIILELSLIGLAMGIATVFVIPSTIEPAFWLVIFIFCAYIIAKKCAHKHFVHGLLLGLANSIWITASHMIFFEQYIANHPREAAMMTSGKAPVSPRAMMARVGPIVGIVSGAVTGALAAAARTLVDRK